MNSGSENKLSMDELMDRLERRMRYLERNSSSQAEYLKQLTEMRGWLPTRTQVDELTQSMAETVAEEIPEEVA